MHAHLNSCRDVNGVAYTAPLAPCSIDECADVKEHGCAGPPQPTAEAMLVIVPGELASSYNDSLPSALVARCTVFSTTQRASASSNPRTTRRKTRRRLKCFPSTDAHRSPIQPARLLLGCMALFQTVQLQPLIYDRQRYQMWAPAAFRLRKHVLLHVRKRPSPPLGTTTRQQNRRCTTFYTSLNSTHARPRPAHKCIVQKRANIVSVKMHPIN